MDEIYSPEHNTELHRYFSKVPNYIASGITKIDYDYLFQKGVKHLVFDIDNTLTSFGARRLDHATTEFLLRLKVRPEVKSLRLATNSVRNLASIRATLDVPIMQPQLGRFKPLPSYYRAILEAAAGVTTANTPPAAVCMIGDKLIQDVWGANYVGMTTVLVRPRGRDYWLDRLLFTRWHERRLLRKYLPKHHETWF